MLPRVPVALLGLALRPPVRPDAELGVAEPVGHLVLLHGDLLRRPVRAVALGLRLVATVGAVRAALRRRVARRERRGHAGVALVVGDVGRQHLAEGVLGVGERDPVLRTLRAGDRRHHRGQVELEPLGVAGLGLVGAGVQPHALLLGVRLHQRDRLVAATGEAQVLQRHVVDREDRAGRAELGAHVADRGAVGQRHRRHALAVELDELADHPVGAQLLGDGEHDVGRGGPGRDRAGQLEADHARDEHRDGLAEHGRLGLDAADAPARARPRPLTIVVCESVPTQVSG